jgi:hypothetical protein
MRVAYRSSAAAVNAIGGGVLGQMSPKLINQICKREPEEIQKYSIFFVDNAVLYNP